MKNEKRRSEEWRNEEIRRIFKQMGGNQAVSEVYKECRSQKVISDEEVSAHENSWGHEIVRKALKTLHPVTRLPFACCVGTEVQGEKPQWKQLDLLDFDEAESHKTDLVKDLRDDYDGLVRFHQWELDTFGKGSAIPMLVAKWDGGK